MKAKLNMPKTLSAAPLVTNETFIPIDDDLVPSADPSPQPTEPDGRNQIAGNESLQLLKHDASPGPAPNGYGPSLLKLQEISTPMESPAGRPVDTQLYEVVPGPISYTPLPAHDSQIFLVPPVNGKPPDPAANCGSYINPAYKSRPSDQDILGSLKPGPVGSEERLWYVALQIAFPYLVAGLGMVGAGVVLDRVQHWRVFEAVTELFILIPPLLGLKGNLEMTLASRISTQANLGHVDTRARYLTMAWGNLALLQVQAICLAFFASALALLIGFIPDGGSINLTHAQILLASCLITTSLASAVLGIVMILVVYITRKYHLNPDNFATPLAASLGDLVTLGILSIMAKYIFTYMMVYGWICLPIILGYLLCVPVWFTMCKRNSFVKSVLNTGWVPIIASMSISSLGGLILDYTVKSFNGIAVFQPVINGVGGNLVAIQASRLSTDFHKLGVPGTFLPSPAEPPATYNVCKTYFSQSFNSKMARLLLSFALPGHVLFMFLISYIKNGRSIITPYFALFYLSVAMLQVAILLYLANVLILNMWRRKVDPDNAAIPYLTAIGDFFGIGFLSLSFFCMFKISPNDPNLAYG